MSEEQKPAEASVVKEEVKDTPNPETPKEEQPKGEKTIADATQPADKPKEEKTVPLATHISEKKRRQEAEKQLEELKNADKPITASSVQEIADDLGVDVDVVNKIAASVKEGVMSEIEPKLSAMEQEKTQAQQKKVLNNLFKTAIEKNPEFKDVANKEVILQLASLEKNKNKTMSDILADTYGKVTESDSPKPMETAKRGGAEVPAEIDFSKLGQLTPEKQSEVLKDPETKAKYNKWVEENLNL